MAPSAVDNSKGVLIRTARKMMRNKRFDKLVSKLAFSPPPPSYQFTKDKGINIQVPKHPEVAKSLTRRGYTARGEFVKTENFGEIPLIYIVPAGMKLKDCEYTILYSHGTSTDIGLSLNNGFKILNNFAKRDQPKTMGIVMWDYPGYGISSFKQTSEGGMREGITTVHDHLRTKHGVEPNTIVAMGQSLGSVPTSFLASQWRSYTLSKIILISPIASAYHVFTNIAPKHGSKEDPVGALSNINALREGCPWPVIVFHGEEDRFVPIEHSEAIIHELRQTPKNDDLLQTAQKVARKELESRLYASDWDNSASSKHILWPSATTIRVNTAESIDMDTSANCFSESLISIPRFDISNEVLFKERSVLLPIPGAGHNDLLKSEHLYSGLRIALPSSSFSHSMLINPDSNEISY